MPDIDLIKEIREEARQKDLNEANTRHLVIDRVIHDFLSWPRNAVRHEEHNQEGYSDYVLYKNHGSPSLVIEAKRGGVYFDVPETFFKKGNSAFIKVKNLCGNGSLKDAIDQVRMYAIEIGCQFACVSNGEQWVFFRAFAQGLEWRELNAFVIRSLDFFVDDFAKSINLFGYEKVVFESSVAALLVDGKSGSREAVRPGVYINNFDVAIGNNNFFKRLRRIGDSVFSDLPESDPGLMEACYVSDADYKKAFNDAKEIIKDSITPYLDEHGIRQTGNDDGKGEVANRIERSVRRPSSKDVVVIFGGKGIGKSTFLRRLLLHRPTQIIFKHSRRAIVDLLNTPKLKDEIHEEIWGQIVSQLDVDGVLRGDRNDLVELFDDHFKVATKQELFGYESTSPEYNKTLNDLVREWKSDKKLCAKYLAKRNARKHYAPVVVIDNTDQFGADLQEFCFTVAHEVSELLDCLVIISMREERFYGSSIHGVLDAFSNSGFHLSAPRSKNVFIKRLAYLVNVLSSEAGCRDFFGENIGKGEREKLRKFFETVRADFISDGSHLGEFVSACAHGNIRLALDLFRGFIRSRYTNVNEITSVARWTFQIHQVLKPIMIPDRFFYDEAQSKIPNVFSLRGSASSSHFTSLRILKYCSAQTYGNHKKFVSMGALVSEIVDKFSMPEDFEKNMDMLLQCRLIESNNRMEEYSRDLDKIRITEYGEYMVSSMWKLFTYIELVSVDTPILDQAVANGIASLSNEEYRLWEQSGTNSHKRNDRVKKRLEKASTFIDYLNKEEQREAELYALDDDELFCGELKSHFESESAIVRRSAMRQRY